MNRETFLRELKYLLQDVAEDEREEALQYYRDYLEDAGPENEENVLQDLGDPARVAAMIRSGLNGAYMGEFSERGYEDPRYRGPSYEVVKAKAKAKRRERSGSSNEQSTEDTRRRASEDRDPYTKEEPQRRQGRNLGMIILIILGAIICSPVVIGLGGGAFGILVGVVAVIFALFLTVGITAVGFLVGGIVALVVGIVRLFLSPLDGILACGAGVGLIGAGLLLFALAAVFYGRFLPWLIRGILDAVRSVFRGSRRGGKAA